VTPTLRPKRRACQCQRSLPSKPRSNRRNPLYPHLFPRLARVTRALPVRRIERERERGGGRSEPFDRVTREMARRVPRVLSIHSRGFKIREPRSVECRECASRQSSTSFSIPRKRSLCSGESFLSTRARSVR